MPDKRFVAKGRGILNTDEPWVGLSAENAAEKRALPVPIFPPADKIAVLFG